MKDFMVDIMLNARKIGIVCVRCKGFMGQIQNNNKKEWIKNANKIGVAKMVYGRRQIGNALLAHFTLRMLY